MSGEGGGFTEDDVAGDFFDAIDREVVGHLGGGLWLRDYEWVGDEGGDDGSWPFVVERDGRKFEIDIDVRVTELTPERLAARAAEEQRVLGMLERIEKSS